jgi:hypothetical protein
MAKKLAGFSDTSYIMYKLHYARRDADGVRKTKSQRQ